MKQEEYDLIIAKTSEMYDQKKAEYLELTNESVEDGRRKFENVRYVYAFVTFRTMEAARHFLKSYDEFQFHITLFRLIPSLVPQDKIDHIRLL